MMRVTVKLYFYEVFGKGLIELKLNDGANLRDVMNELNGRFGAKFEEKTERKLETIFDKPFNVFLNGRRLNLPTDLGQILKDGDNLLILKPVGGG